MRNLLKENVVLIAGIVLPFLLIAFFVSARMISESGVPDPQYEVVFATPNYAFQYYSFHIENGKLHVDFKAPKDRNYNIGDIVKLYIFDGKTRQLETVQLIAPKTSGDETSVPVDIGKASNLVLTDKAAAPDGYRFEKSDYQNSSFITDIFSYNSNRIPNRLVKNGRIIPVSLSDNSDSVFIGWVVKK